ncbi:MAG: hypothetical protein PHJ00_05790 [Candidatus Omnitrophica bacterium]|nr:hypothetical protein [Candidatus Omnitrophota bacterium]MDD5654793.1 hypothetical protein [Candidatus Omnitrophota bacterium]
MAVKKLKKKPVKRPLPKKKSISRKKSSLKKVPAKKAKKSVRAPEKKAVLATKKKAEKGVVVGIITHYFPKVRAAVIKLKAPLSVGDTIRVKGHTTDFTESINSIQIDRVPINAAKKGQEIGLLVNSRVRQHDLVYKV